MGEPVFIGLDWGTSAFRAYLADGDGAALAILGEGAGALTLKSGEHEPYLAERLAPWLARTPGLPVVACGMVGAKQGWAEAPYVACPAGLKEIAAAALPVAARFGRVWIAPGARADDRRGAPDVMRGEETQILGALAAGGGDGVYVLPGTHSKWARVEQGRIAGFETFMTGEVFAVLKTHSVLGRMMAPATPGEGFARGVDAAGALDRPGDLLHALFAARTFGLFERLPADQLAEYLSGLLIGAEICAGARGAKTAIAIGSAALSARYVEAGERLAVTIASAPENCALLGLRELLPGLSSRPER